MCFTFEGNVETATVSVGIGVGTSSEWNLIGNPYTTYINSEDFLNANAGLGDKRCLFLLVLEDFTNVFLAIPSLAIKVFDPNIIMDIKPTLINKIVL